VASIGVRDEAIRAPGRSFPFRSTVRLVLREVIEKIPARFIGTEPVLCAAA